MNLGPFRLGGPFYGSEKVEIPIPDKPGSFKVDYKFKMKPAGYGLIAGIVAIPAYFIFRKKKKK